MDISQTLREIEAKIAQFDSQVKIEHVGKVKSLADGVAHISGLRQVASGELLSFPRGIYGIALNLEEEKTGAIILGDYLKLKEGDEVKATGRPLSIPAGKAFLGRVIDPLGRPLDGKGEIKFEKYCALERVAPGVTEREPVDTPLQTGIAAIDSLTPIGRGQRELIIGDRGTGKTTLVLDTIINQRSATSNQQPVFCIYVAIGQKTARVAKVIETLEKHQALKHTIVVMADASSSASLQYLAPYAGCSLGEFFMDKGEDAAVFYDDLTKHAWAYREISLILRRPSGREAYPGDIFYTHSRLLERSCRLSNQRGGGSLTALPIVETQASDISSYISTNVISITDGQIYLESDLFYAGVRPAINVGLSVSRVGGAAQIKAMKQVAGKLRLDLAQYRELSAFAQFASELDSKTREQIEQGSRMVELLKQDQQEPMPVEEQVVAIWAAGAGFLQKIPVVKIRDFKKEYLTYLKDEESEILAKIKKEKKLKEEMIKKLEKVTYAFLNKRFKNV